MEIQKVSSNILNTYFWDQRKEKDNVAKIPEELKESILEQLKANVPEYEGSYIPYFTLANIIGIYNRIKYEDEDGIVFIVAPPGYGKSTQALIFGKFIDTSINSSRIIFDIEELKKFLGFAVKELRKEKEAQATGKIYNSTLKGKAVILDEGVFMLFSGDAQTKEGKLIQKLLSVIRALNLLIIVNATNFRKINKGVKEDRIIGLIRLSRKGVIEFQSKKKIRRIKIQENNIYWGRSNFTERTGKLDKNSQYWKDYELKKADFLVGAIDDEPKGNKTKKGRPKNKEKGEVIENDY